MTTATKTASKATCGNCESLRDRIEKMLAQETERAVQQQFMIFEIRGEQERFMAKVSIAASLLRKIDLAQGQNHATLLASAIEILTDSKSKSG